MPLNDDQLRAIGRISVAINELEFLMNIFASGLINPNLNIGLRVLEGEQFNRVLDRVRRLADYVLADDPGLLSRVKKWAERARDVQHRRSEVMHSLWTLDQPTGKMVGLLALRRDMPEVDASPDELNGLAIDIVGVRRELSKIIDDMPSFHRSRGSPSSRHSYWLILQKL